MTLILKHFGNLSFLVFRGPGFEFLTMKINCTWASSILNFADLQCFTVDSQRIGINPSFAGHLMTPTNWCWSHVCIVGLLDAHFGWGEGLIGIIDPACRATRCEFYVPWKMGWGPGKGEEDSKIKKRGRRRQKEHDFALSSSLSS